MKFFLLYFIISINLLHSQNPFFFDKIMEHEKVVATIAVIEETNEFFSLSKSLGFDYKDNKIVLNRMDNKANITWQNLCCEFNDDSLVYNPNYGNLFKINNKYITAGMKKNSEKKINDIFLMQFNKNGEKEWERVYGGKKYEYCVAVQPTLDKGYILAGNSYSFTDTLYGDYYVIKTDSLGEIKWQRSFGNKTQINILDNVIAMDDGSYVVAGIESAGPDIYIRHVIGLDTLGKVKWDRILGGTKFYNVAFSRLNKAKDGNIIFSSGIARGDNKIWDGNIFDAYIAKISKTGNIKWEKKEISKKFTSEAYLTTLEQNDGTILVLGHSQSHDSVDYHWYPGHPFISKLDNKGNVIWRQDHVYDSISGGYWGNMIQTSDGGILAYGYTLGKGWIRKMDSLARFDIGTFIDYFSEEKSSTHIKLFPNPSSTIIKIDITIPQYDPSIKTEVVVVDVSGAIVMRYMMPEFAYIAELDISKLPSGVYGVQLRQPQKSGTRVLATEKLVVVE